MDKQNKVNTKSKFLLKMLYLKFVINYQDSFIIDDDQFINLFQEHFKEILIIFSTLVKLCK